MKNITDFFSSLSDNLSITKTNFARSIIKSANDESNTIHSQCRTVKLRPLDLYSQRRTDIPGVKDECIFFKTAMTCF